MANSKSQRWLKFVLMPTISILENEGWGAGVCQALLTDPPPAHPESHATLNSSSAASETYLLCTRRKSGQRIQNSLIDMADTHPSRCRSGGRDSYRTLVLSKSSPMVMGAENCHALGSLHGLLFSSSSGSRCSVP